jgi:hypothetical protein
MGDDNEIMGYDRRRAELSRTPLHKNQDTAGIEK